MADNFGLKIGVEVEKKFKKALSDINQSFKSFASLVSVLDDISLWLDPTTGLKQLIFDDVPDRYFMARLNERVECERLLVRSAGSFDLKFFCPNPFAYAVVDEKFAITTTGLHTVKRTKGNVAH